MQDGQNLSDPSIAFGGNTWQLEGALAALRERGIEPIVVGIHHAGPGAWPSTARLPIRGMAAGSGSAIADS